jgi:hypothetical protein
VYCWPTGLYLWVLFPDFVFLVIPELCEDDFCIALKLAAQFLLIRLFWNYACQPIRAWRAIESRKDSFEPSFVLR